MQMCFSLQHLLGFSTSYLRCVTWLTILNNFGRNACIEVVVSMTIKEGFVVKQRRDPQRKLRADTFCKNEQKKTSLNFSFYKTMVIKIIRGFCIHTNRHSFLSFHLQSVKRRHITQSEIFLISFENCISIQEKEMSKAAPNGQRRRCRKEQCFLKGQAMERVHTREKLSSVIYEFILNLPCMPSGPREMTWPSLFPIILGE